jgi:hypothetical protein
MFAESSIFVYVRAERRRLYQGLSYTTRLEGGNQCRNICNKELDTYYRHYCIVTTLQLRVASRNQDYHTVTFLGFGLSASPLDRLGVGGINCGDRPAAEKFAGTNQNMASPFSFHCIICIEEFDQRDRYPVVLPCGHTYVCNQCMWNT